MTKPERLGDGPIEEKHLDAMTMVAHGLDEIFNGTAKGDERQTGFILLVFPFNSTDGRCNYISNGANRKDVVVMLKEQIARFEGQPELKGTA